LAEYFDPGREIEAGSRLLRCGMGLGQQVAAGQRTPGAQVTVTVLEKVDRPVELAGPARGDDFSPTLVDQDERTGVKHRVHRTILEPDQAVTMRPRE
jgi:hypothetical protein